MLPFLTLLGVLLFPVFASDPVVHPHVPKVVGVNGAAGSIQFRYFTVPYNPKHLEGLEEGTSWHLGFAQVVSEVPFLFGHEKVPAGKYKLDAVRGATNGDWNLRVIPLDLWMAKRTRRTTDGRTREELVAEKLEELKQKGIAESYEIRSLSRFDTKADPEQHADLGFEVATTGYVAKDRRTWEPHSGVTGKFRIEFGAIHVETLFTELYPFDEKGERVERGK